MWKLWVYLSFLYSTITTVQIRKNRDNEKKEVMLQISPAPHITSPENIKKIMYGVVLALTPALIGSIYFFGWRALFLTGLAVLSAVITEWTFQRVTGREIRCLL